MSTSRLYVLNVTFCVYEHYGLSSLSSVTNEIAAIGRPFALLICTEPYSLQGAFVFPSSSLVLTSHLPLHWQA